MLCDTGRRPFHKNVLVGVEIDDSRSDKPKPNADDCHDSFDSLGIGNLLDGRFKPRCLMPFAPVAEGVSKNILDELGRVLVGGDRFRGWFGIDQVTAESDPIPCSPALDLS